MKEAREIEAELSCETPSTGTVGDTTDAGINPTGVAETSKPSWVSRVSRRVRQPFATVARRTTAFVGPRGTYERGFILSAGTIVGVLTILRLVGETSPLYGIGISALILASTLAPRLRRGIEMKRRGKPLQNSPAKSALTCILCSPLFTYLAAPAALGRSTKAALWTSWVGMLGGTVALLASIA